jgi:hypothetical protein
MSFNTPANAGIIKMIVLIVIALLILSYFGYNIRSIVNAPNTQDNFSYVGGVVVDVWNNYLKTPATYIWDIFVNLIWNPAIDNLKNIKAGGNPNSELQSMAPSLTPPTGTR